VSGFTFDGPVWPPGDEWPSGVLPPPSLTVEIAAIELEVLIEHHDSYGAEARARHEHDVELFHMARASYLRQRLAMVAPHRLTPDRKGHA
jgi:hypothetical protein